MNSRKDDPMFAISKMLLNSLYGRFGMSPDLENHVIIPDAKLDELLKKGSEVTNTSRLADDLILVGYKDDQNEMGSHLNISIGVAAAITS